MRSPPPGVVHPGRDARGKSGWDGQQWIIVAVFLVGRNRRSRIAPIFVPSENRRNAADALLRPTSQPSIMPPHHQNRRREPMTNRREFLQTTAGALSGLVFVGCDLMAAAPARAQTRRREVVVNGKRVKTVDVHAHCAVPEALALMNLKLAGRALRPDLDMAIASGGAAAGHGRAGHRRRGAEHQPQLVQDRIATSPSRSSRSRTRSWRRRARPIPSGSSPSPRWRCSIPILPPSSSRRASRSTACAGRPSAATSPARRSPTRSSTRSGPRRRSSACWSSSIRRATAPRRSSASASRATAISAT